MASGAVPAGEMTHMKGERVFDKNRWKGGTFHLMGHPRAKTDNSQESNYQGIYKKSE